MNAFLKTLAFLVLGGLSFIANAQQNEQQIATDPVYLFNEICYTQVPEVIKIQDMAKRFAWVPMSEERLESFASVKEASLIEGWDIRLAERIYRLGIVQSEPLDSFLGTFPDMAGGLATSCTMVLDGLDDAQTISERLNVMVGKAPTIEDEVEGATLTTTWSGGNDTTKVFVVFQSDDEQRANLINVTIVNL